MKKTGFSCKVALGFTGENLQGIGVSG